MNFNLSGLNPILSDLTFRTSPANADSSNFTFSLLPSNSAQVGGLYDISVSFLSIGWIAAILTILVGLPQLVYIIRTKNVKGMSLPSFWSFFVSLIFFSLLGLLLINDQLAYTEFIAAVVFGIQMVFIIKYWTFKTHNKIKKIVAYAFSALFVVINMIFMILHIERVLGVNVADIPTSVADFRQFVSIVGPIISMLSFLPQTIKGIRTKQLYHLPFSFVFVLAAFNGLWIVSWLLNVGYYANLTNYWHNPGLVDGFKNNVLNEIPNYSFDSVLATKLDGFHDSMTTYIINTVFQIVGFSVSATQIFFWARQVKGKKIIWF
ncbi:PQ-loop domain-containing transporter [[Mycoplasma] testudinis]|uniref:PQ-loop domain-containing transporter n=1 Tax=[Mycoplasma] testudinis TaxID=33924 RepID=UPI000488717E|nr:PQ-loop domain-containing transporter [[Mycoplasma] testudinis]